MAQYNFAFSYSRWSLWKKCPKAYKLKNVDKVDTGPTSKALINGRKVHEAVATYLQGGASEQPPQLSKHFHTVGFGLRQKYKAKYCTVERQMAFDRDNRPVSWFGKNAYTRFIWDVLVTDHRRSSDVTKAQAVDWKTGKPYGSYADQMQIFSIPAFWAYPKLETFSGHLLYLDSGEDREFEVTRDQFYNGVERTWLGNIRMMESDQAFLPTPSKEACRFCDFGPRNLGICGEAVG